MDLGLSGVRDSELEDVITGKDEENAELKHQR